MINGVLYFFLIYDNIFVIYDCFRTCSHPLVARVSDEKAAANRVVSRGGEHRNAPPACSVVDGTGVKRTDYNVK